jgi:hypothetical protein
MIPNDDEVVASFHISNYLVEMRLGVSKYEDGPQPDQNCFAVAEVHEKCSKPLVFVGVNLRDSYQFVVLQQSTFNGDGFDLPISLFR